MNFELKIDGVSVDEIGIKTERTDFTEQELDALVAYAGANYNAAKWLIADMAALLDARHHWHVAVELKKGKSAYDNLVKVTGYSKGTLRHMACTSRRIPHDDRRDGVPFYIYIDLAHSNLSRDDVKIMLDKYVKEKLTLTQLRKMLRKHRSTENTKESMKNAKTINYIWRNRNAIKKLHKVVDELDVVEVSEAMGAIEPYFRAFQTVMGRLLYLQNATNGLQDDKLNAAVAAAQNNNKTKIKR